MLTKIIVLCTYFLIVLVIGFIARTRWKSTPDAYFLADRKFGTLILLGTMIVGLGAPIMEPLLWVFVVLTGFTVVQRIRKTWQQLDA